MLTLRWQETTVNLSCTMLQRSEAMPLLTGSGPELPLKAPWSLSQWKPHRSKRYVKWPMPYPYHPHYPHYPCYPYYSVYIPPVTTTTAPPTTVKPSVNLDLWRKLIELYPLYGRYLDNKIPLNTLLNLHKHPGWQLLQHLPEKPKVSQNPLQHLFGYHPTPPPTKPKRPSSSGYPGSQRGPSYFDKNPLLQSIFKEDVPDHKPGTQTQALINSYQQFLASLAQRMLSPEHQT